ncbi:hypothetical protein FPSE_06501 [Fusarium pseudograminearum CS3096]|uniref:Uncharacterized protein n=1 Tax=Fusarium pseudograminearum (strain CS3096) TaxID=1028729 RepID=K3VGW7_FUSPC|nr:hypothetical protein FPSE_06501 [Fusarium pseudograminearum CS3096]EKJ73344.1 hypothetical protein FPSE_06501 [Fusarium pseudograminearum CS3096]
MASKEEEGKGSHHPSSWSGDSSGQAIAPSTRERHR